MKRRLLLVILLPLLALGAFTGAYSNFMYAFILCQDSSMWIPRAAGINR